MKGSDFMAQANVNIRMDEELKKQFVKFCDDVGMNMTTAVCVFAKAVVAQQRFPFEIKANDTTKQAMKNVEKGANMSKSFDSVKSLMKDLNAED